MNERQKELMEMNKLVNTLTIAVDTYSKNYNRLINKTNESIEYKEVDLDRSMELKQQTKLLAESMIYKKEQIKKLLDKLQNMVDDI
ncbi:MAG: hypothetical protein II309_00085 [Bacilli bacterium]|nr:hypothetical protein [Bacilli bacterium]